MKDYSEQHKKAWEFDAYAFWVQRNGTPEELAQRDAENPRAMLRKYAQYFDRFEGVRVANICGSCGKKAIPLALLGAEVTVFDISEQNRRYAMETARAANVGIRYEVCDVLEIDREQYGGFFDVVFMEGGILHYFHDISEFMGIMYALLKPGGKLICSDFHPMTKVMDTLKMGMPSVGYFNTEIIECEMAHARFYEEAIRKQIPTCSLRKYTVSEIINAIIDSGFVLKRFDEHPSWEDPDLPGEFTAIAVRPAS